MAFPEYGTGNSRAKQILKGKRKAKKKGSPFVPEGGYRRQTGSSTQARPIPTHNVGRYGKRRRLPREGANPRTLGNKRGSRNRPGFRPI